MALNAKANPNYVPKRVSTANSLRGGQETLAVPWRLRIDRSTRIFCSRSLPTSKSTGRPRLKKCVSYPLFPTVP
jgi:hypothetical protein